MRFASPLNDRRPTTIARVAVRSDGSVRQEVPGSARVRKRQHELLEGVMRPAVNRHNGYSSFFITIFPMHRQDNRLVHQRTESILMCMQQIDKLGWKGWATFSPAFCGSSSFIFRGHGGCPRLRACRKGTIETL